MLNFKNRGINIDSNTKCALKCPKCIRENYKKVNKKIPGREMPLTDFKKLINYFKTITFCGQISDPTSYSNLINTLKICKIKNLACWIHTASSHRKINWYEEAFNESHKYRINQKGEYLFEIMKLAIKKDIQVRWQYIICKYNENHIEIAKNLAIDNNIIFEPIYSTRWDNNDIYKPSNYIKRSKASEKIYPRCILAKQPLAYTATGYLIPCCYVDKYYSSIPPQIKLLYKEHLKLENNKDVKSIINSKEWIEFFKTLRNNPPTICKYICNKPFTIKEAMTVF